MALANRIAQIVRDEQCFGDFDEPPTRQLTMLAELAGLHLDHNEVVFDDRTMVILHVSCGAVEETLRMRKPTDWFPPTVLVAYLNGKLADHKRDERFVASNDSEEETVALCTPEQAAELHACIFARIDDLRWPRQRREPLELELLATIRAHPDDDGARLVYADWLIEREDPRGHFIMLQCHPDLAVRERADALLVVHEPAWTCHLPAWALWPRFARGFPTEITRGDGRRIRLTADGQVPAVPTLER